MEYVVMAVTISILISAGVTYWLSIDLYKDISDELFKERKKTIVTRAVLKGLLEGRDKEKLLQHYEESLKDLEEAE